MLVVKKTMQKQLAVGAVFITALTITSFSFAQSIGGVIQGAPAQQSQQYQSSAGNVQPVNQNAQLVLQLQALRAELASLRNQVEQQGYQLRQLQQGANVSAVPVDNSVNNYSQYDQNVQQAPVQTAPNTTFQSGEILPNQAGNGAVNQPNGAPATSGDSVQFPLLPQDQVGQAPVNNGSQALPQLVPEQTSTNQFNQAQQQAPVGQQSQGLSRQDRLLEDGNKLKGLQTDLGELDLYNKGIDKLSSQEYKAAASIFSAQLQNFPRGQKAGDGYFWLGETFYIQDDLDSAAKSYQTLVDLFPNHIRTPKALLKLIGVHQDRNDLVSAKTAMNTLIARYSGSVEASSARSQYSSLL